MAMGIMKSLLIKNEAKLNLIVLVWVCFFFFTFAPKKDARWEGTLDFNDFLNSHIFLTTLS